MCYVNISKLAKKILYKAACIGNNSKQTVINIILIPQNY